MIIKTKHESIFITNYAKYILVYIKVFFSEKDLAINSISKPKKNSSHGVAWPKKTPYVL